MLETGSLFIQGPNVASQLYVGFARCWVRFDRSLYRVATLPVGAIGIVLVYDLLVFQHRSHVQLGLDFGDGQPPAGGVGCARDRAGPFSGRVKSIITDGENTPVGTVEGRHLTTSAAEDKGH